MIRSIYPVIQPNPLIFSGIRFDGDGVGHGCGRDAYLGFNVGWSVKGNSELAPKVMNKLFVILHCPPINQSINQSGRQSQRDP